MNIKTNWNKQNLGSVVGNNNDMNIDSESLNEQKKERYRQNTKARKYMMVWVCTIVSVWLIFAITFAFCLYLANKELSDGVIIAIFGTCTVNVLGLANIVLRGLFNVNTNV